MALYKKCLSGVPVGAYVARRLPERRLKLLCGLMLVMVGAAAIAKEVEKGVRAAGVRLAATHPFGRVEAWGRRVQCERLLAHDAADGSGLLLMRHEVGLPASGLHDGQR